MVPCVLKERPSMVGFVLFMWCLGLFDLGPWVGEATWWKGDPLCELRVYYLVFVRVVNHFSNRNDIRDGCRTDVCIAIFDRWMMKDFIPCQASRCLEKKDVLMTSLWHAKRGQPALLEKFTTLTLVYKILLCIAIDTSLLTFFSVFFFPCIFFALLKMTSTVKPDILLCFILLG